MSYDVDDAAWDEMYDRLSDELYPEHKEHAIRSFIEERMQSYFLNNPEVIRAPMDCYHHAHELIDLSPRCALVMYCTAIELFLKSVLLRPVLSGMVHNERVADAVVAATTGQSGFGRYNKLLSSLCLHAADIDLSKIKGPDHKSVLTAATEVQNVRNDVVHSGHRATIEELETAKRIAGIILMEVVEPVLNSLNLAIGGDEDGLLVVKT